MSELNKTTIFFGVALAAVALALFTRPSTEEYDVNELQGKLLVEVFPAEAPKRLRVTSLNEETGDVDAFEVAEMDGVWSIPSKGGYPADATDQMAAAVEGVVGREILSATDAGAGDHTTYGVVDPSNSTAEEGFGTHVQLSDAEDNVLADIIIGDEVGDRAGQYYVRKAEQDVVYTTEIDLDKFSTDFANWIERDLLGLSTFDVAQVYIDDYTIETELFLTRSGIAKGISGEDRRAQMRLNYNDDDSKWQAESLKMFDQSKQSYEPFELQANEELNEDALRELKDALDDLEIVDVEKKPDGLSADLQAGADFLNNNETLQSLMQRGFLPVRKDPDNPQSDINLLSSEGEIVVTLNSGVEYVLRFGDLQLDPTEQAERASGEEPAEDQTNDDEGLNRYLFVMARFNESVMDKPKLEELPELPSEEAAEEEASEEEGTEEPSEEEAEAESEQGDEASEESSETADESKPTADNNGDASDDGEAEEGGETEDEAEAEEEGPSREEVEAERARIEQSNKRAEEEYSEKIEESKARVEELNARFGDWYYVIPNDVFKKIHLGRDQVVKTVEPEKSDEPTSDESALGAPGDAIPGLPSISADADESEDVVEEEVADE